MLRFLDAMCLLFYISQDITLRPLWMTVSAFSHISIVKSRCCKTVMLNLTFIGPCIVIYSYNKTNEMPQFLKFIFGNKTLHVSDRISVHHQETSTVYTAICICHTGFADFLLAGSGWFYYKYVSRCTVLWISNAVKFRMSNPAYSWPFSSFVMQKN
jgi:hypothetical protein